MELDDLEPLPIAARQELCEAAGDVSLPGPGRAIEDQLLLALEQVNDVVQEAGVYVELAGELLKGRGLGYGRWCHWRHRRCGRLAPEGAELRVVVLHQPPDQALGVEHVA